MKINNDSISGTFHMGRFPHSINHVRLTLVWSNYNSVSLSVYIQLLFLCETSLNFILSCPMFRDVKRPQRRVGSTVKQLICSEQTQSWISTTINLMIIHSYKRYATHTVKPLIMSPPKSGQPLYLKHTNYLCLIDFTIL